MDQQSNFKETNLLDTYSRNLSYLKPNLTDVFICPLCFEKFYLADAKPLENKSTLITIEHIPPKSLGGKPLTLTCKKCNNFAGRELDSDLLNSLLLRDFLEGRSAAVVDSVIESAGKKIRAKIELSGKTNFLLSYPGNRNNPKDLAEFQKNFRKSMKISFEGDYRKSVRTQRPDWSVLRIAYLYAFSVFGYGFVLANPNLDPIREQINNPTKKILTHWGYESNIGLSDDHLGISVVETPNELRSFLVVFDLATSTSKRRYGILLPGPTAPGLNIYKTLMTAADRKAELSLRKIPNDIEYLTNPKLCMASSIYWNILQSELL